MARRNAHPEAALQVSCKKFVRDCVDGDCLFLAFDRSRKQSPLQHVREASRGIRAGTPDTVVICGGKTAWIELKARGGKPTDAQLHIAGEIQKAGGYWSWADSVERYRQCLFECGIPLRPNAAIVAMHYDALLFNTAAIRLAWDRDAAAAKPRPRRASKPAKEKPSPASLKRMAAFYERARQE